MVWICWTVILIGGKAVNANPALSEAAEQLRLPRKAFILTFIPFCAGDYLERGTVEHHTFVAYKIYFKEKPSLFRMNNALCEISNIDSAQIVPQFTHVQISLSNMPDSSIFFFFRRSIYCQACLITCRLACVF